MEVKLFGTYKTDEFNMIYENYKINDYIYYSSGYYDYNFKIHKSRIIDIDELDQIVYIMEGIDYIMKPFYRISKSESRLYMLLYKANHLTKEYIDYALVHFPEALI